MDYTFGCILIVTKPLPQKLNSLAQLFLALALKQALFLPLLTMLVENAFLICPLSEVFYPLTVPFFLLSFLETSYLLPSPNALSKRREPALTFEHLPKISMSHGCVSLGRMVPWEGAGLTLDRDPEDS